MSRVLVTPTPTSMRYPRLLPALLLATLAACTPDQPTQPGAQPGGDDPPPPPASSSAPVLHVDQTHLRDEHGNVVRLHGVSRSGSEYACAQGWGFFDGPSDDASVAAIAAWHVNAVRIPLNETCWLGINGVAAEYSGAAYRLAIANYVRLVNAHGMLAILDLHLTAPGGEQAQQQHPMPDRDHSPEFWRQVASTFKDWPSVAFDLFNEPYPDSNQDTWEAWRCWRDGGWCAGVDYEAAGMTELVTAVRSTGARNLLLLGGVRYSAALSRWLTFRPEDPANNLTAAWHVYDFSWCAERTCWETDAAPVLAHFPLVLSEIGEQDHGSAFVTELMDWMDAHDGSYLAWSWDAWPGYEMDLVASYDGTPSEYGRTFHDRFAVGR